MPEATSPRPALDGVTVLDFSTVGPAARCTRILADYGATVVKVGAPPTRSGVQIEPAFFAYAAAAATKRVRLDLKAPAGKAAFLRLAERADVVVESFRPGVVARLGIGYEDVRRVNPRIVYCSTSGYGQEGPAAGWAGHDLNYLALGRLPRDAAARRADGGAAASRRDDRRRRRRRHARGDRRSSPRSLRRAATGRAPTSTSPSRTACSR